nr:DUF4347 domain-containing protein [uncultured Comamonas sp.]
MFDGAGAVDVVHAVANGAEGFDTLADTSSALRHALMAEAPSASNQRQEVVFVDGQVANLAELLQGLPGTEVVVLDSNQDGLQQIADYLKNRSGIDAIHLLSHGADGTVELGNTWLNAENIGQHSAALNAIGAALAADGDILLYGCSTAEGTQGTALLNELARLTQADVAGSVDPTGAADKGGDWQLERQTGQIEAASLNLVDYRSLLATPADQNFDGQPQRYLNNAGETINGITYSLVQPTVGSDAKMAITQVPANVSITSPSDLAIMFNYDGVIIIPGAVDARMASADGSEFRLVSMEIDTGTDIGTSSQLTIKGYRNGIEVASDTLDTAFSDSTGSVTYTKNGILNGFGGTLTFSSAWQNIDEIRITGNDTIVVVDDLKFAPAVLPNSAPVITPSGGSAAFVEGNNATSTPVAIDPGLTLSDPDSLTLSSAKVLISGNFHAGEDSLGFNPSAATGDISGSYNAGTGTLTLTSSGGATVAQWQAALRSVTYTNSSDAPNVSSRTVSFSISDGPNESSTVTRPVTITAVDDTPVISAPTSTMVVEDMASVLKQISISDADSNNGTVTLSVGSGSLAATSGGGVTVGGTSSALTLTGNLADVNAFIANNRVTYTTAANATADVTLTIAVDTGSVSTDTKTMTLTVAPVNDAPVVTVPGNITVVEDVPGALTHISFSDVDSGSGSVTVTFSVPSGTLSAVSGSGVTVSDSGTGTLTLSGTLSDINAFIAASNVTFQTALDNTSSVQLTVSINDNGNTGGSALTDTKTVTINVTAVNDAPVNSVPAAQSTSRDVALAFNTVQSNAISISDVDAGSSLMTVTLSAVNGTLSLTATSGVMLVLGTGVNNSVIRLQGSQADINATLQSLTFKPNAGFVGTAQLSIQTNDEGNTGSGGAKSDTDTVLISVNNPNPSVSNVVAYGPNGNGPYKAGDTITVAIEFNQNVYVAGGPPTLLLETGTIDRIATYTGGSGTNTLFFTYTVQAGDRSADLDYQSSTALALNGATIANSQADAAIVSLPTPGSAGSLGANANIVIDTVAPTVNSATFPTSGTYVAGQVLDFRFNFTEALIVDTSGNTPYLEINIGGQIRHAEYFSGSSTSTLVFRYIVQSGDSDSDGIAMSDNVRFTGVSIRDAAGNPLDPRFTAGATPGIQVDALAPEVTDITLDGPAGPGTQTFTVTFSENVSGVTANDFSLLTTGSASGTLNSITQISPNTYRITVDTISGQGNLGLTLNAANSNIVDSHGNALAVSFSTPGYAVGTVLPAQPVLQVDSNVAWPSFDSTWGGSLPGAFAASTGASALEFGGEPPARTGGSHTFFALGNSGGSVLGASGFPSFFTGGVASENQELSHGFLGTGGVFGTSTFSGLFSLAMPESEKADPGLIVRNALDALETGAGQQVDWQVPPTLFGHSDPLASIQLSMTQADGQPLPAWLKFDARTGKLTGTMPEGFRGELVLRLTARDSQGHAVHTPIKLKAVDAAPVARTGVAEQLQHAAQLRTGQMTAQRLHI